ncbi:DMT family transporter [Mesorhizobium sp.]|uniref:EamA family transporter n=1 Tax=Mesorhizobium sp. TaxID=1871066 RepID=UPI0012079CDB|nr:DMT family transporter [Mesorhizobium sp.]TIS53245.1 MAG: DMT family transporter [Mesorhizobium sp.]TIS88550.1 MAG: DMT family transporter [Mesorhizobium sp.]
MTSTPIIKPVSEALPIAALLGAMVSIQIGATFAKGLFPLVGTQGTTALRLVVGALILAVVLRPWRVRPSKAVWPWLIAYGVTLAALNLLFYAALRTIPLGIAVALEFTGPLLVATLSSRRGSDFAWVALAVAGIVLLSPFVHARQALDPAGVMLALAAGGCWALYIVFAQKAGAELGGQTTAYGMAIAAVLALPFGVAEAGSALVAPPILAGAVVVGLFSSALPFWLEMVALTRMPARLYGTLTCLEPALGALAGFLFLHEVLSGLQCAGVAAVIAAAFGAAVTTKPPVPSPE